MKPEGELIQGIEEETAEEIRRIKSELERTERERTAAAEREIAEVRREIEERSEAQRQRLARAAKARVSAEVHRLELEAQERFFAQITEGAEARIRSLMETPAYRELLSGWIIEAAVGLGVPEAVVQSSASERELCLELLPEAERRAGEILGHEVHLRASSTPTTSGQGVILTASSGRTAYNNQVRTRIMRHRTEIRRIIYEELSRARARNGKGEGHAGRGQEWTNES